MAGKTEQLQIRVTPAEKATIKRLASAAGMDVSTWVLSRTVPAQGERFRGLLAALSSADPSDRSHVLAELNDFLASLENGELENAVELADLGSLPAHDRNYVAAMVEVACARKGALPPAWAAEIPPLERPRFAVSLRSLRPHLLRASPVPFKRRNLFVDASIGDRV